MHGFSYDPIHDELVVNSPLAQAILTFRGGANGEEAPVRVIQGPTILVQAASSGVKKKKLKNILPIYEEGAADIDLVKEGGRNLRDYLQSEGYFIVWNGA